MEGGPAGPATGSLNKPSGMETSPTRKSKFVRLRNVINIHYSAVDVPIN